VIASRPIHLGRLLSPQVSALQEIRSTQQFRPKLSECDNAKSSRHGFVWLVRNPAWSVGRLLPLSVGGEQSHREPQCWRDAVRTSPHPTGYFWTASMGTGCFWTVGCRWTKWTASLARLRFTIRPLAANRQFAKGQLGTAVLSWTGH